MNTFHNDDVDPLTAPVGTQFVVKQHHASALHHDVRLEMLDGEMPVLVSWAVPKGLPRRRGVRHLAIRTPDHSMEEATVSTTILDDDYGVARIFDRGSYEMVARTDDRITFRLDGDRLLGVWHLVHTGRRDGKDQWLALMSEDMRPASDDPPPRAEPMLATSTDEPFDDPDWVFEPRWDGIRAIAFCGEETSLIAHEREDVTSAFPELQRLHNQIVALEAMLDGVIVGFDDGVPSAQLLQVRMRLRDKRRIEQVAKTTPVVFVVFDLIFIDGKDLTHRPLVERRQLLEETVVTSAQIQVSPVTESHGVALYSAAAAQGLEGIIAKRRNSAYQPGTRSPDWLALQIATD